MRAVHPTEILGEEIAELGLSANALAKVLGTNSGTPLEKLRLP